MSRQGASHWAVAATLGRGTPAPPFTGKPADTSAKKTRADRKTLACCRKLRKPKEQKHD